MGSPDFCLFLCPMDFVAKDPQDWPTGDTQDGRESGARCPTSAPQDLPSPSLCQEAKVMLGFSRGDRSASATLLPSSGAFETEKRRLQSKAERGPLEIHPSTGSHYSQLGRLIHSKGCTIPLLMNPCFRGSVARGAGTILHHGSHPPRTPTKKPNSRTPKKEGKKGCPPPDPRSPPFPPQRTTRPLNPNSPTQVILPRAWVITPCSASVWGSSATWRSW